MPAYQKVTMIMSSVFVVFSFFFLLCALPQTLINMARHSQHACHGVISWWQQWTCACLFLVFVSAVEWLSLTSTQVLHCKKQVEALGVQVFCEQVFIFTANLDLVSLLNTFSFCFSHYVIHLKCFGFNLLLVDWRSSSLSTKNMVYFICLVFCYSAAA